ncbi:MAG: ATP-binding protein [bacterium]
MVKKVYIHRQIEESLKAFVKEFPAVVLTGPRQTGKSTLLAHIFAKSHKILSFDDPLLRERALLDPKFFLEKAGDRVIFDEIQYVPEILSFIKMLIDKDRQKKGRFIMTGSCAFNLMKNLTETLVGRVGILVLLPFAKGEIENISFLKSMTSQDYFIHSCLQGTFPEVCLEKRDSSRWYGSYISTYLERDIRSLYNIGNLRDFQRFLQLLASRCAQVLNLSSLSLDLGVAVNTVKKWISALEASQLIYLLPAYYQNLGKRITKNPKVYFLDSGLVCYLTGLKDEGHLIKGPMAGSLFENYCIQETVKFFFNHGQRPNLFYLRTHNGLEIDLIIERDKALYPVEFKMSKTINLKMADPIKRFKDLFSKLKIKEGRIVSLCEEDFPLSKDVFSQDIKGYIMWLEETFLSF